MKARQIAATGGQAGLGMLEVLIAVIIISIAATILIISSRTAVTGQQRSRAYGDAATAVKEAMEIIQMLPLDSISRMSDTPLEHSQGPSVAVKASARGVLPSDVTNFASQDTSTLRYITLQASFKSQAGFTVTKIFTTVIYKP